MLSSGPVCNNQTYINILSYNKLSVYTREKLKSYKVLGAYNIVIWDLMFNDYSIEDDVALKADVLPSQMP